MKKFITFVPMQRGSTLLCKKYEAPDNPRLNMDKKIHFPIVAVVNGYIKKDETFLVFAIMEKDNADCRSNLELMRSELYEVADEVGACCQTVTIAIPKEENIEAHLQTFTMLVNNIEDNDEVFTCITFGTKPTPIIEFTALNLVNKLKKNVCIECIAYGKINRSYNKDTDSYNVDSAYIYDVTSLFYVNSIADSLDRLNTKNPVDIIKQIMDI